MNYNDNQEEEYFATDEDCHETPWINRLKSFGYFLLCWIGLTMFNMLFAARIDWSKYSTYGKKMVVGEYFGSTFAIFIIILAVTQFIMKRKQAPFSKTLLISFLVAVGFYLMVAASYLQNLINITTGCDMVSAIAFIIQLVFMLLLTLGPGLLLRFEIIRKPLGNGIAWAVSVVLFFCNHIFFAYLGETKGRIGLLLGMVCCKYILTYERILQEDALDAIEPFVNEQTYDFISTRYQKKVGKELVQLARKMESQALTNEQFEGKLLGILKALQ